MFRHRLTNHLVEAIPLHILSACADYTYGNDYDETGKMMYGKGVSQYYHWDKRDYTYEYPPGNFPLLPNEVCRLCSICTSISALDVDVHSIA